MSRKPAKPTKASKSAKSSEAVKSSKSSKSAKSAKVVATVGSPRRAARTPPEAAAGSPGEQAYAEAAALMAEVDRRVSRRRGVDPAQLQALNAALRLFNAGALQFVRGEPITARVGSSPTPGEVDDGRESAPGGGRAARPGSVRALGSASRGLEAFGIQDATTGATPSNQLRDFFEQVGAGAIAAQRRLDVESHAYLAEVAATGVVPPTVFRLPRVEAELSFAAERIDSRGFSVIVASSKSQETESYRNSVKFEIVAAPPPIDMARQHAAHFPALTQLVLGPLDRARLLARLAKAAEASGKLAAGDPLLPDGPPGSARLLMLRQRRQVTRRTGPAADGEQWDRGAGSTLFVRVEACPSGQPFVPVGPNQRFGSVAVAAARLDDDKPEDGTPATLEVDAVPVELVGAARVLGAALLDLVDWQESLLAMLGAGVSADGS